MKENYLVDNLLIGNLVTTHNMGGIHGPIDSVSGPFIFNKLSNEEGKKSKYKEVFTEDEYKLTSDIEKQKFGKTYIVELNGYSVYDYLNESEKLTGNVEKHRLVEIYNAILTQKTIKMYEQDQLEKELEKKYINKK